MRRSIDKIGHDDPVALFAQHFKRLLDRWHLDAFEFGALVLAAVLLLCPLFRLGTWLAEQHVAAQRRIAFAEEAECDRADGDGDGDNNCDGDGDVDDHDDTEDHEEEARMQGALKGARIKGERV